MAKKRKINLDYIIQKYLHEFDPIQQFIDEQQASLLGRLQGGKAYEGGYEKGAPGEAYQDALADAIDRKYFWAKDPGGVNLMLEKAGYMQREIARMFNISSRTVRRWKKYFLLSSFS